MQYTLCSWWLCGSFGIELEKQAAPGWGLSIASLTHCRIVLALGQSRRCYCISASVWIRRALLKQSWWSLLSVLWAAASGGSPWERDSFHMRYLLGAQQVLPHCTCVFGPWDQAGPPSSDAPAAQLACTDTACEMGRIGWCKHNSWVRVTA